MRHDQKMVMAQQTCRVASTTRRKIGSSVPDGLRGALRLHCDAAAGTSLHTAMS
jgi:acetyl-CoA carboxylase alpha subunit